MAKKIIMLCMSFIALTSISSILYAQNGLQESCQEAKKTLNEKDIQKCLKGDLDSKREKLINLFKDIREIKDRGTSFQPLTPATNYQPAPVQAPAATAYPEPTVIRSGGSQGSQTQPSAPGKKRVNPYNY